MSPTDERFSTGVRFVDKRLGGGIPAGGLLALVAPAGSQSELLFKALASAETVWYLSTICTDEDELREIVDPTGDRAHDLTVEYVPPEALIDDPAAFADDIPPGTCVVIDTVNGLEAAPGEDYLAFLNRLKARLRATGSIAILHGLADEPIPEGRPLTLKRADHIWQLELAVSDELVTRLIIPKSRGYQVLTEPLQLELVDEVNVDTSRNIA